MSSSFDEFDGDSSAVPTQPFEEEYVPYDTPLASQGLDSLSSFADSDSVALDDSFTSESIPKSTYSPPIYVADGEFSSDPTEFESFASEGDGKKPVLPPMEEMQAEEGFALREWRRQNTIQLEEKEKREKELLSQIIDEANDYKSDFYSRRKVTCETNKVTYREKEKVFVANQEKFYLEADKNYWKTIAELVPKEVPAIEKKRGKKDQKKQPLVVVIQGPKPGKPTELSRMRHILLKLKHDTPPHLKTSAALTDANAKDAKTDAVDANAPKAVAVA